MSKRILTPHPSPLTSHGFLGIDFGTSGARAIAIDPDGNILADVRLSFDEQSAEVWREALHQLLDLVPAAVRRILRAIAIDGTSGTALLCDNCNQPLCSPLLYNDTRAQTEAKSLEGVAPVGNPVLSPSSSLAKLLWFQTQPEFGSARFFVHQADWLASLLHGQPGLSDYHNSLKLGYDPAALRYPAWLLGLPVAHLLPRVLPPGTEVGRITTEIARLYSIPAECVVRAGTTDSIAAFLASGARRPGQAVTSLGSTLVLKLLSDHRVDASQYGVYSHRLGNSWLAGGASNSGGAVLHDYFSNAEIANLSAHIDPTISSGLDYYPLPQAGERFPVNDPDLQPRLMPRPEDNARFLQGMLEGIARIEARGYRLLEQLGATPLESIQTAGGGAANPTWNVIRSRMLGVPVQPAVQVEAAYGTALLAARGENLVSCH